jgi:hypothetical protein
MSAKRSLWEVLSEVTDPRGRRGKRYALPAVLTLTSVAMLSGARSLYAIAQFGRDYGADFAKALGFAKGDTPCCTTLHYLFQELDAEEFERALGGWLRERQETGWKAISLDGKRLRGTQGHELAGVHLLAAYAHEAHAVLAQLPVKGQTNEHKVALRLLNIMPIRDTVVTGDAMFCQKDLSRKVLKKGGHYVWPVKDNQKNLKEEITVALSDKAASPSGTTDRRKGTPVRAKRRQGPRSDGTAADRDDNRS